MDYIDLFVSLLAENIDSMASGTMPKGKFLGKYVSGLKGLNLEPKELVSAKEYLVVNSSGGLTWLDYVVGLSLEERQAFMESLIVQ